MEQKQTEQRKRVLTDADVDALLEQAATRFYNNLGKGLWSLVWRVGMIALVAIAAYGATKGHS